MHSPYVKPAFGELRRRVLSYGHQNNVSEKRLREMIGYTMLGGLLESLPAEAPRATIKGGVAIEMRLHPTQRATLDLDIAIHATAESLIDTFEKLIMDETGRPRVQRGFSFARKGRASRLPHAGQRITVQIMYGTRSWTTITIDLAIAELADLPREKVRAIDLTPFGLEGPLTLDVLHLSAQIPQKIHGMTRPPRDDEARNERVRDLVDILLLRERLPELPELKAGCIAEFERSATHAWPPTPVAHPHWEVEFAQLAREYSLPFSSLDEGIAEVAKIIRAIDSAS